MEIRMPIGVDQVIQGAGGVGTGAVERFLDGGICFTGQGALISLGGIGIGKLLGTTADCE